MTKQRYIFLFLHLIAVLCVLISLLTGLRIRALTDENWLWISSVLPQGQLHSIHFLSGISFTSVVFGYLLLVLLNKKKHSFSVTKNKSFYHVKVNQFGYLIAPFLMFSGWLHWWQPVGFNSGLLHYTATIGMMVYVVLHGYVYFLQIGIRSLFRFLVKPLSYSTQYVTIPAIFAVSAFGFWLVMGSQKSHYLDIYSIPNDQYIDIDGEDSESFWQEAPILMIETTGGENFNNGMTTVSIQAVANEDEAYFLFRWKDETKSINHLPLTKRKGKWQVKQNGFYNFDEVEFYEDKFAVMLSETCEFGADGTIHLGKKPISDKPANWHGKGYHASLDGKVRDIWHWKAVRTNEMYLADDNFFGPPLSVNAGERRYTAGYYADGKESGAYVMNWDWYTPNSVVPKRLPVNHETAAGKDDYANYLKWFASEPYQNNKDTFPDGAELHSILYRSNRFEGDRADVRARGTWRDGYWTVEMSRKLDTLSDYDVALKAGTCLWVAAFDHAQVAHTRHHRPIKLEFTP